MAEPAAVSAASHGAETTQGSRRGSDASLKGALDAAAQKDAMQDEMLRVTAARELQLARQRAATIEQQAEQAAVAKHIEAEKVRRGGA